MSTVSGSFVALSKKMASVGETIMASSASTPEVPFWTKFHPAAALVTDALPRSTERKREVSHIVFLVIERLVPLDYIDRDLAA